MMSSVVCEVVQESISSFLFTLNTRRFKNGKVARRLQTVSQSLHLEPCGIDAKDAESVVRNYKEMDDEKRSIHRKHDDPGSRSGTRQPADEQQYERTERLHHGHIQEAFEKLFRTTRNAQLLRSCLCL